MIKSIERVDLEEGGYIVTTDKHIIKILIYNVQDCCESWGFITSEDDTEYFVGADFIKLEVVDEEYKVREFDFLTQLDEGGAVFVNLHTSLGVLQFVLYNSHNGYYGHYVHISVDDATIFEEVL